MVILALKPANNQYFGSHDPSVSIFVDGNLRGLIEEERMVRVKHACGQFPAEAVKRLIEYTGVDPADIDTVCLPFEPSKWQHLSLESRKQADSNAIAYLRGKLSPLIGGDNSYRISFCNHHYAHACSAFYCSGFSNALVMTADGTGERYSTVLWSANKDGIKPLRGIKYPQSLGYLYSLFTEFFGFRPDSGEGQTMGLAAHGGACGRILKIFNESVAGFDGENYFLNRNLLKLSHLDRLNYLEKVFGVNRNNKGTDNFDQTYKDMAFCLQFFIESSVISMVKSALKENSLKNVCLAGGLFMNISVNSALLASSGCENLFAQPLAGDVGATMGAGIAEIVRTGATFSFGDSLYLGPSYTPDYFEKVLAGKGASYTIPIDKYSVAVKMLVEGKIILWFNGRMEAGARSLGNRSILANPTIEKMKDKLNTVKGRELWRPLAISILDYSAPEFLEGTIPTCAEFMILAFRVKEDKKKLIPSALHVDGTTRPHVCTKKGNQELYKLLKLFYDKTGVPVLLNTSMNGRGEPIVENPEQALQLFWNNDYDALFLGDYLLAK